MAPKLAIMYYSIYGHVRTLALSAAQGIKNAGGKVDVYQIPETLPENVLKAMNAPPKSNDPIASPQTLMEYDGIIFGIPTRFGNQPSQWRNFWEMTGGMWVKASLSGKYASTMISTGSIGGGQEITALNSLSTFAHHGMIYVPLGYKKAGQYFQGLDEVHGGSPWGAGTFASGDGSRQVTELEKKIAEAQGEWFYEVTSKAF